MHMEPTAWNLAVASYVHVKLCLVCMEITQAPLCFKIPAQLNQPSDSSTQYIRNWMSEKYHTNSNESLAQYWHLQAQGGTTKHRRTISFIIVWTLPFQLGWAEGIRAATSPWHNEHLISLAEQIKQWLESKTKQLCFHCAKCENPREDFYSFFLLPDRAWNHREAFPPLHNNLPL